MLPSSVIESVSGRVIANVAFQTLSDGPLVSVSVLALRSIAHAKPPTVSFINWKLIAAGIWKTARRHRVASVSSGGRVLTVCARGADLREARARAYAAAEKIRFDGMFYRRDIGYRALAPR